MTSQPRTGQSTSYGDVQSSYGGAGGWDRRGCTTGAPRSANRQGEEQHRHTERGSHTKRDKGEHSRQGGGAQQGRRGSQNSGNREPEWSEWWSVRIAGSDNKGDGLASQPRRYRVPGQPLLNRHQVGGVSRSPDGLFAQQEREPIRGRPAVRGKRTYGGRPGQRVEEQGLGLTHTETQRGRLRTACGLRRVDSTNSQTTPATTRNTARQVADGLRTEVCVQQKQSNNPHNNQHNPQYANYRAPLTRKRHIPPPPAQPQHTNHWAPRTRKRHQPEHQKAATRRNMRREERATVQGPVKKQQPNGMSHRGWVLPPP